MKSTLVFPRISNMPAPSRSALSAEITTSQISQDAQRVTLDAQLLDFTALVDDIENDLGADQGREQVDRDAKTQRDRKSLDRPGPEQKKGDARYERRHVRIDDGEQGLVVTSVHRQPDALSASQFFTDPLEDQHVRLHAPAHSHPDAGDARQGEGRRQGRQGSHQTDQIENQREVGNHAREPVVDHHKYHHYYAGDQGGPYAFHNRILA